MSEIRNPGIKCGIRINKEAFKNFVSEKGSNLKEITEVLGISHGALYAMLNRGTFTVYMLYRLSSLFGVEPKDMEFIDDPAHKLLYQLCIPFDGPRQKGNKIARIREYLAQRLDRLKIRELLVPSTLMHSAVSEAFDNVANSEEKTLGTVISECAEELSANVDAQVPRDPKGFQDVPYADLYDDDGEETHDSDVDDRDQIIEDLQATLKEREGWIADLRLDLSLRDKWLAHQKSYLDKKDKEIEELKYKLNKLYGYTAEIPTRRKPIMIDFNISVRERDDNGTPHVLPPLLVSCQSRQYVKKTELDRPLVYTTELSERVDSPNEVETVISAFVSMGIEKMYKEEETENEGN